MRDLKELNVNEGGKPVDRSPPTDQQVESFESRFSVKLPDEYLMLLRQSNGGHPELDGFHPKGVPEPELVGIDRFYYLGSDQNDIEGLWRATTEWQAATGKNIIPIAYDPGGNQIALSYETPSPLVYLCIHDDEFRMIHVADSFGEFIDMLCEDPDMI